MKAPPSISDRCLSSVSFKIKEFCSEDFVHDTSWALATKVRLLCGEAESVAAVEGLRNQLRALAEKRLGEFVSLYQEYWKF